MIIISNPRLGGISQQFREEEISFLVNSLPKKFDQSIKNRLIQVLSDDSYRH